MSLRYSTGCRDKMLKFKSFRQVFEDSKIYIYTGAQPATADAAATGSLIVTLTKASGTVTSKSTRQISITKITTRGSDGDKHIMTIDGVAYEYTVVTADTVATIAANLAALIDANEYVEAVQGGGANITEEVIIMRSRFAGATAFVAVASNTGSAVTATVEDFVATAAGNGLRFGNPSSAVISKSADVWSGVVSLAGTNTAGWFRMVEYGGNPASISTTEARVDGSIGVGLGDGQVGNTSMEYAATITLATAAFTFPYAE